MYVVGLGSNLGDRFSTLAEAAARIDRAEGCRVLARSRVYESEPLGPPQPLFLNAAVLVDSSLSPEAQLDVLLGVEASLGRVRELRWGPRVIDLDLLWGATAYSSDRLSVPHAGLSQRWWALAPLLDVARSRTELSPLVAAGEAQLAALGGVPYGVRSATFGAEAARRFDVAGGANGT